MPISEVGRYYFFKQTARAGTVPRFHIDSLALVELIFFVEQEFSIEVPLDEIDHFRSIRSIAALIADGIALRNAERAAS
ncbi:MAG: hypothetical protein DMF61_16640 [Blastocatellia bacterium AA13]|nr:MAG: hypothetical protein DMF61_16640 [Blastocatellia bacterium AA13]